MYETLKEADFLRAMEDPEGTGAIDAEREREIARIEQRLAEAADAASNDAARPDGRDCS